MSSFTCEQYEKTFRFAARVFIDADEGSLAEMEAALMMWMIEDVIGQQLDFPQQAREWYPREMFRELQRTTTRKR